MGGGIFISYRRDDTAPYARMLSQALADRFGRDRIYRDLDSMSPGVDFPKAIEHALRTCDAVLVVIGPSWLGIGAKGGRRIDDLADHVRKEVAAALARRDVLVVPVLIEATRMPGRTELPDALAGLTDRMAHRLADEGWGDDVRHLITALEQVVTPSELAQPEVAPAVVESNGGTTSTGRRRPTRRTVALILLVGAALVAAGVLMTKCGDERNGDGSARAVVKCSFGPITVSAKPGERFADGFSILVGIENGTGKQFNPPDGTDVSVQDSTRRELEVSERSSWPRYVYEDLPPGARYEESLVIVGERLPAPGAPLRVGFEVDDCPVTLEGFRAP